LQKGTKKQKILVKSRPVSKATSAMRFLLPIFVWDKIGKMLVIFNLLRG
jgi:hypothetical protein